MSTATAAPSVPRVVGALPSRGLPIPRPPGRREGVVAAALQRLADKYATERQRALATIEKYGLTIEVDRLRDRLSRSATTELQRLLLSTPGVPEALLNLAIARQLEELEAGQNNRDEEVKNATVARLGDLGDTLGTALLEALAGLSATTQQLESHSQRLVDALDKIADATAASRQHPTTAPNRPRTAKKPSNPPASAPGSDGEGGTR